MAAQRSMKAILNVDGDKALKKDLADARALLTNRRALHQAIGLTLVDGGTVNGRRFRGVSEHITRAAVFRHTTADTLGASRTGYLEKAAQGLRAIGTDTEFGFNIEANAEPFSRTFHPVYVRVKNRKWLAMPCDKRTYGKSPLNFPGMLDFIVLIPGRLACWVMRKEPKKQQEVKVQKPKKPRKARKSRPIERGEMDIVFWGKKSVKLPQDRGLLPNDTEFLNLIDAGLNAELRRVLKVD